MGDETRELCNEFEFVSTICILFIFSQIIE